MCRGTAVLAYAINDGAVFVCIRGDFLTVIQLIITSTAVLQVMYMDDPLGDSVFQIDLYIEGTVDLFRDIV